jgi:hypothetical protein
MHLVANFSLSQSSQIPSIPKISAEGYTNLNSITRLLCKSDPMPGIASIMTDGNHYLPGGEGLDLTFNELNECIAQGGTVLYPYACLVGEEQRDDYFPTMVSLYGGYFNGAGTMGVYFNELNSKIGQLMEPREMHVFNMTSLQGVFVRWNPVEEGIYRTGVQVVEGDVIDKKPVKRYLRGARS